MDVERLQRINALAGELKKQNFALSSDDAYRQAEGVYAEGNGAQVVVEEVSHVQHSDGALSLRKFELMIELNNKKYEAEFALYRNAINQLAAELEAVRSELRQRSQEAQVPKQKEKQAELKSEVKEAHPRQGNFTPSDVDIQKMFYFGNKR